MNWLKHCQFLQYMLQCTYIQGLCLMTMFNNIHFKINWKLACLEHDLWCQWRGSRVHLPGLWNVKHWHTCRGTKYLDDLTFWSEWSVWSVFLPSCITMRMIAESIWVSMKDFLWCQSIKLIHTCQKTTEMCHSSHVVVTRFNTTRLLMRLWVTASFLTVSLALPWPTMSQSVCHTYSNMVPYQWKISHKEQMT